MASPEFVTMIECTVELTQDFANNLEAISDLLLSKHLISPSVKERAVHSVHELPSSRASQLVSILTSRIEIQPEAFQQMVELLDPTYFSLSLSALKNKYQQNGGKDLPMPTVISPAPSMPGTTQINQGLLGDHHQMQLPDYSSVPTKRTVTRNNNFQPTPNFIDPSVSHNEYTSHPTSAPPSYHQFPEQSTDVPDAAITLDSCPEAEDLLWLEKNNKNIRIIPRVAADWENLAVQLGLERYIIKVIKADYAKCEDACIEMFRRWLYGEGDGPRTWVNVASAVEKIDDHETAYLIRQVLGGET